MKTEFTITERAVMFKQMRLRPELREEDPKPDADLMFSMRTTNEDLAMLGSELRSSLYKAGDDQDMVGGAMTVLRNPELGKLKIEKEIIGAKTTVHFGLGKTAGKNSDIALDNTIIDRFTVEPIEGGSVVIAWRVRCKLKGDEIGRLGMLLGREASLSIAAPEAAQGSLIDGTAGPSSVDQTGANVALKD